MPLDLERPESFLGALAAIEGIADGYGIIHGPTGCKYYPASVSENSYPMRGGTAETRNVFQFSDKYFFSQPRLPCTYLDMGKFVTGGKERLKDLYAKVTALKPSVIAVINSPGASLVGEDIASVGGDIPTVYIDHAEYSGTCAESFQSAIIGILEVLEPVRTDEKKGVNLVGISILHRNWKDSVSDLSHLLELCGITVNCTVGAGWTAEDVRKSASAKLNVLIYPEYGEKVACWYRDRFGIEYMDCGVPVGFDSIEEWIAEICQNMGVSPSPAMEYIKRARTRTARCVELMESYHMLPRGRTFSLMCDGSTAFAVTKFLYGYLGMIPVAVTCTNGKEWQEKTKDFIESRRIPYSDDALHTEADVMITNGSVGSACVSRGIVKGFVEMEAPCTEYVFVRPEPPIGIGGTMMIIDRVLNIIASRQRFI